MKIKKEIDLLDFLAPEEIDKIKKRYSEKVDQAMLDYSDKPFGEFMQVLENYKRDMRHELKRAVRKARAIHI